MTNRKLERDPVGRAFADLTAVLEDTVSLAVLGQDLKLSVGRRRSIVHRIHHRVVRAGAVLNRIERSLTRLGGGSP